MNIKQLFNSVDPARVISYHNEQYPSLNLNLNAWQRFLSIINSKVVVTSSDYIDIHHLAEEYDNPEHNNERFDVSLVSDGESYSPSFTPWGQWIGMSYKNSSQFQLTDDQIAAHIFYEMTWYGFEEDMISKRDELLDSIEEIDRALSNSDSDIEIPEGCRIVDDNFFRLLYDTEEGYQGHLRRVEELKTRRLYKNGKLVE